MIGVLSCNTRPDATPDACALAGAIRGNTANLAHGGAPLILKAPGFAVGAPGSAMEGGEAADAALLWLTSATDTPMADGALLAIALVREGATFR